MLNVFKISRMTIHNGPGIRTLVHFKGCPLRCVWCSAPESQERETRLGLHTGKCIACKACAAVCSTGALNPGEDGKPLLDRKKCNNCFACIDECYPEALVRIGDVWSAGELVQEILKDKAFFRRSRGGVTFSGGEPLMYMDEELEQVFRMLKEEDISIGVDTTGYVPFENIGRILPFTDFFLWDLKQMNTELHKKYTGVGNERIIENLKEVNEKATLYHTEIYIRCPIIPDMTDSDEHLLKVCGLVRRLEAVKEIHLLPFHQLGKERYEFCGKEYVLKEQPLIPPEVIEAKKRLVLSQGISCRIVG